MVRSDGPASMSGLQLNRIKSDKLTNIRNKLIERQKAYEHHERVGKVLLQFKV